MPRKRKHVHGVRRKDKCMIVDRDRKVAVIFCKRIDTCQKPCKKYSTWLNKGYCMMCVRLDDVRTRSQLLERALEVCALVGKLGRVEENPAR